MKRKLFIIAVVLLVLAIGTISVFAGSHGTKASFTDTAVNGLCEKNHCQSHHETHHNGHHDNCSGNINN